MLFTVSNLLVNIEMLKTQICIILNSISFYHIDFDLDDNDTCRATVRMFLQCNLVQQFHIPYDVRIQKKRNSISDNIL